MVMITFPIKDFLPRKVCSQKFERWVSFFFMDFADKIRKIEALIASTSSEGERKAAEFAKQRLLEKADAQPLEYKIGSDGLWKKRLFMALCQKHGLSPYRRSGQKRTTTLVRSTKPFMDEVLWPEYLKYATAFDELASDILNDLVQKIHRVSDEDEREISGAISSATTETV